jgi:hypothetical protein
VGSLRGWVTLVPYLAGGRRSRIASPRALCPGSSSPGCRVIALYSLAPRSQAPDDWRAYTCWVGGVMPDAAADGQETGACARKRSCDPGLVCLTCAPDHRICTKRPPD